jgi:hypothetical protein
MAAAEIIGKVSERDGLGNFAAPTFAALANAALIALAVPRRNRINLEKLEKSKNL